MDAQIFIVDDDADFRGLLGEFLASLGYAVREFPSAEAVLAHLGTGDDAPSSSVRKEPAGPCLVISDVQMGEISGLELARALKRRLPALPVVLMTGFGGAEAGRSARESGAEACLDKPFALDAVQDLVERLVHRAA